LASPFASKINGYFSLAAETVTTIEKCALSPPRHINAPTPAAICSSLIAKHD
jgi:hypothetical protein